VDNAADDFHQATIKKGKTKDWIFIFKNNKKMNWLKLL
jgi:hypothetical protein